MSDLVLSVEGITALEGCNGCNLHGFNAKAIEMAKLRGIPYTGGSDAHESGDVGSCYTVFEDEVTEENFLDLLKSGRYHGVDMRKVSKVWPW